jgi:arylsulfatase A-like enzyme
MKHKLLIALAVVAFLCAAGRTQPTQSAQSIVKAQGWEYRQACIVTSDYKKIGNDTAQLNQLGAEGWELVSVTQAGYLYCYHFKRGK